MAVAQAQRLAQARPDQALPFFTGFDDLGGERPAAAPLPGNRSALGGQGRAGAAVPGQAGMEIGDEGV